MDASIRQASAQKGHSLLRKEPGLVVSSWARSEMREKPGCAGPTQGERGLPAEAGGVGRGSSLL